jgi:hypothetical protein
MASDALILATPATAGRRRAQLMVVLDVTIVNVAPAAYPACAGILRDRPGAYAASFGGLMLLGGVRDRLFISRWTVQTHLTHVFAKLDITPGPARSPGDPAPGQPATRGHRPRRRVAHTAVLRTHRDNSRPQRLGLLGGNRRRRIGVYCS